MARIPLMIIPLKDAASRAKSWRGLAGKIVKLYPKISTELYQTDLDVGADEYILASMLNAVLAGALMSLLLLATLTALKANIDKAIALSAISGGLVFVLFFVILTMYPGILAGKKAELVERDLVYALKDMLLEVSSGASIYMALKGVAEAGYGEVSKEFHDVAGKVNVGVPVEDALSDLALKSKSEHLKNSIWQVVNALKSGSSMEGVLRELVKELTVERKTRIRKYAQELNIMILAYMLFAVVVPTIATTLVIVLGPFMGVSMGPRIFYIILPFCFAIQIMLMEYIKSRRPVVYI